MLNLDNSIRGPGEINTFPQGESSDEVSVPASILREILEELQELREEIDRLKANQKRQESQSSDANQEEEPVQKASISEPKKKSKTRRSFF